MRVDHRNPDQLRPINFIARPQKAPAGSVLIEWGNTKVICAATVEEKTPKWMNQNDATGWITAEYFMLPGSSDSRIPRERSLHNGRTQEIQRLIGRSLRAAVNLKDIGLRSIMIDCDVLQADGGTRVASICGGYMALYMALHGLVQKGKLDRIPPIKQIAAVSIGKVNGEILTDLNYHEDVRASLDANVVMNSDSQFIEMQGTAEEGSFTREEWNQLMDAAETSCQRIFNLQYEALRKWELID